MLTVHCFSNAFVYDNVISSTIALHGIVYRLDKYAPYSERIKYLNMSTLSNRRKKQDRSTSGTEVKWPSSYRGTTE